MDFQNLMGIEFCWRLIFQFRSSKNIPWGHVGSLKKSGPDQFSHFLRLLDTNKQTDVQAKYIYIDVEKKVQSLVS